MLFSLHLLFDKIFESVLYMKTLLCSILPQASKIALNTHDQQHVRSVAALLILFIILHHMQCNEVSTDSAPEKDARLFVGTYIFCSVQHTSTCDYETSLL